MKEQFLVFLTELMNANPDVTEKYMTVTCLNFPVNMLRLILML